MISRSTGRRLFCDVGKPLLSAPFRAHNVRKTVFSFYIGASRCSRMHPFPRAPTRDAPTHGCLGEREWQHEHHPRVILRAVRYDTQHVAAPLVGAWGGVVQRANTHRRTMPLGSRLVPKVGFEPTRAFMPNGF